jgi:ketosteroid isomerase-like protein
MIKRVVAAVVVVLACAAPVVNAKPLTAVQLTSWLQSYGKAWETRDAAAVTKLFTENATYHEMPFDTPKQGRAGIDEYWRGVTADQRDVQFKYEVISVAGNTGVAHWSAKFRAESTGATIELDGVFVLEFDSSGLCSGLREWWHVKVSEAHAK